MSGKMMSRIWALELAPAKQIVLLALADHADHDGGSIRPGVPLIAWKTGYSERQVQRLLRELVAEGLLVEVATEKGKAHAYSLDLSKGGFKPPYQPRKPGRPRTSDKMSSPLSQKGVTPRASDAAKRGDVIASPQLREKAVTSYAKDDSKSGDIASADSTRIRHTEEPSLKTINAPAGASTDSEILWLQGDDPRFEDSATPAPYPCTPREVNALIAAWWAWTPKRPTRRGKLVPSRQHFANRENRAYAENLVQRGVLPADFVRALADIRASIDAREWAYLRDKELTFCYVAPIVEAWARRDRAENWYTADAPRITPRRPDVAVDLGEIKEGDNLLERLAQHPDLYVDLPPPYRAPGDLDDGDLSDLMDADEPYDSAALLAELEIPL
jgi:hypothetical protein